MLERHKIILDEAKFNSFLDSLSALADGEAWYGCLMARKKYDGSVVDGRTNSLARIVARSVVEFKEKVRRLETAVGTYSRDGGTVTQQSLVMYMSVNPRSLKKANLALLVTMAKRFAEGDYTFNAVSAAQTEVHRAAGTKHFVDFDLDGALLPDLSWLPAKRIIATYSGFHVAVRPDMLTGVKDWYRRMTAIPGCDRQGDELTPVPGCTQGNCCPYVLEDA